MPAIGREMIIPYACAGVPAAGACPILTVTPGEPLRLNSHAGDPLPAAGDDADPLLPLRLQLIRGCDLWNATARRFVEHYLNFAAALVEAGRADIEAGGATASGLFSYTDFVFSAPRPIPRAHLPVAGTGDAAERVAVDFAFWTGEHFVAVVIGPPRLLPAQLRRQRERLAAAGHGLVTALPATAQDWRLLFAQLLPEDRQPFWRREVLPCGPHAGTALDRLTALATHPAGARA